MSSDIFGYAGRRVVIMGCFSGPGEAGARQLGELGAEVHGADIKPSPVNLASFTHVDLKDPASIEAGVRSIGGEIDAAENAILAAVIEGGIVGREGDAIERAFSRRGLARERRGGIN